MKFHKKTWQKNKWKIVLNGNDFWADLENGFITQLPGKWICPHEFAN